VEHPPPLSRRVTEDVFPCEQSTNPHRPAAAAASSRPLPGGGQCMAIVRIAVHGKETGFHGVFGETDKSLPPTGHRIDGRITPLGEGLDGEGGGTPPPLSRRVTEDVFPCEQSTNPHLPSPLSPQCRLAKNRMMPL